MHIKRIWDSQVFRWGFPIVTLLALVLALLPPTVFAIPQLGHYFYGDVTADGMQVPVGLPLTARIKGTTLEFSTVVDSDGHFGYSPSSFSIPGDDPQTPEREGARSGDLIEFYVAGRLARVQKIGGTDREPSGVWRYDYPWFSGETTELQVDVELPEIGLSVEKVVTEPVVGIGSEVRFRITVENTGGEDLESVWLSDVFSPCLTFLSATQDGQPVSEIGPDSPLEWDLGPLAAGARTEVELTFRAVDVSEACVNTVSVTGVDIWQRQAEADAEASVTIVLLKQFMPIILKVLRSP